MKKIFKDDITIQVVITLALLLAIDFVEVIFYAVIYSNNQ